ncbi:MAG: hypothetical protein QG657_1292 [Acidobacteriota bacterium]|nr:hypothetical protein [Acidobacteriota bacterium]
MKNININRFASLIKKDILIARNKIGYLLVFYIIYFVVAFFSLSEVRTLFTISQGNFITIFLVLFLFQTSFIIAFMLFPQFIYKESMTEKHEIYFAYQYSIFEIVMAKSIILCGLSILPGYIILFAIFYPLLVFSASFIFCISIAIPFISFAFIALNVLFSWFTKGGRMISTALLLIFIFFTTQIRKIINPSVNVSYWDVSLILMAIAIVLTTGITLSSISIKKERCIIKE